MLCFSADVARSRWHIRGTADLIPRARRFEEEVEPLAYYLQAGNRDAWDIVPNAPHDTRR